MAAAVGMPYGAGPPAAGGGGYDYAEYEYEYEDESGTGRAGGGDGGGAAAAAVDLPEGATPSARALAVAQAEAKAYLADRIPDDAFNKRLELQDSQAIYAMQRGTVLFKYNAGNGSNLRELTSYCIPPPTAHRLPPPTTTGTTPARGCLARRATARGSSPGSCRCDV